MKRFLALILTLCMMISVAAFPASANEPAFSMSASVQTHATPTFSYAYSMGEDDDGYTVYETFLDPTPTFEESEYYANSLNDHLKQLYRAFVDAFCEIELDELSLKQKVKLSYGKNYYVTINTQEELEEFFYEKLYEEAEKYDIQTLYNAIQYDHTELFWMQGVSGETSANIRYQNGLATMEWTLSMSVDASPLFSSNQELYSAADIMNWTVGFLLADAPTTNEYDKLVFFNDWLKTWNTYNQKHLENSNYPLAHTAYSAFTSNAEADIGPVCQGYAYALKYLCDKAGIHSVVVTGDLYQTGSAPDPHAWNAVEIDGNWYAIDVTANDSLGTDIYNFLAGSTTASHDAGYPTFSASHVTDNVHTYPTLSATAYQPSAVPQGLVYYVDEGGIIISDYRGDAKIIEIPARIDGYPVMTIGKEAFLDCKSIEKVILPDTITVIGSAAFKNCTELKTINIPDGVGSIGNEAFYKCQNLTEIVFPISVVTIGKSAFSNCHSLVSVDIPKYLSVIEEFAFSNCIRLQHVNIPNGVETIERCAFIHCYALKEIDIPDSVKDIGDHAFASCYDAQTIEIGNSVKYLDEQVFSGCISVTSVRIPASVLYIDDSAFSYCYALAEIEVDEENVNYMSIDGVLYGKEKKGIVKYPEARTNSSYEVLDGVVSIARYAFNGSTNLKEITLPNTLMGIGDYAFESCTGLTDVYYYGTEEEKEALVIGNKNEPLTNATWHYKTESDFEYTVEDGEAVITGYNGTASELIIPDEIDSYPVVGIADYAFYNNTALTAVYFPNTLRYIGEYAFYGCTSLLGDLGQTIWSVRSEVSAILTIPNSVTYIGAYAFGGCDSLAEVALGSSVESIGDGAFSDCTALETINIPTSVTTIGNSVFTGCDSLVKVRYEGSADDKENIDFGSGNDNLFDIWQNTVTRLPGDVNGDGIVNNKDLGILRQFLNKWDVTINESNADVTGDGVVNNKDMGILRQFLNKWDVVLK